MLLPTWNVLVAPGCVEFAGGVPAERLPFALSAEVLEGNVVAPAAEPLDITDALGA